MLVAAEVADAASAERRGRSWSSSHSIFSLTAWRVPSLTRRVVNCESSGSSSANSFFMSTTCSSETGSAVVTLPVRIETLMLLFLPKLEGLHFRSEEHTSELQSRRDLVCRLLLEKKKKKKKD